MAKKLELKDLKIQSFVTSLNDKQSAELKGGNKWESCPTCPDECHSTNCTVMPGCSSDLPCTHYCTTDC